MLRMRAFFFIADKSVIHFCDFLSRCFNFVGAHSNGNFHSVSVFHFHFICSKYIPVLNFIVLSLSISNLPFKLISK